MSSRQLVTLTALGLAALAACATPRPSPPPPPPQAIVPPAAPTAPTAPESSPYPSPAEQLPSFALVREHPAVAAATADLAAATAPDRPAVLVRRAREAVAAALRMRQGPEGPFFVPSLARDYPRYLAFYELAERDLEELLALHPDAPEAAEARYLSGLVCDYPHLERFDEALAAYRETIERHPGSPWAERARERIRALEEITSAGMGGPHGAAAPAPSPESPPPPR